MEDIFDSNLQAQPKAPVKLLEKDIQSRCVDFARAQGFWARKFSSPANRGVPDYLFSKSFPGGKFVKWAEEFKAPLKGSTAKQLEEQAAMRKAGWIVFTDTGQWGHADIDAFKRRILALIQTGGDAFEV